MKKVMNCRRIPRIGLLDVARWVPDSSTSGGGQGAPNPGGGYGGEASVGEYERRNATILDPALGENGSAGARGSKKSPFQRIVTFKRTLRTFKT